MLFTRPPYEFLDDKSDDLNHLFKGEMRGLLGLILGGSSQLVKWLGSPPFINLGKLV